MTLKEVYCDLFSLQNKFILAHCISSDFALGAGIAKQFANRGVRDALYNQYLVDKWEGHGYCCIIDKPNLKVANLVTKQKYWQKPTLITLAEALIDFRNQLKDDYIAMPQIGCGLDKLSWKDVKPLIEDIFNDTDCTINVCILPK